MDCLCHIVCPCFSASGSQENDFDVIPEKGDYYGDTDFKGAKHGHGMLMFGNGDLYEGEWKNDKMHGFGEYRFSNGEILNGYFEQGKYIGDPPPGAQAKATGSKQNEPRPLTPNSILSDKKPTKVKHNEMSYSFAQTVGNLTKALDKKKKKKKGEDDTDNDERKSLLPPPDMTNRIDYQATQHHSDPRIAAQMAMDRERKNRERRERVERIKKKYNISA